MVDFQDTFFNQLINVLTAEINNGNEKKMTCYVAVFLFNVSPGFRNLLSGILFLDECLAADPCILVTMATSGQARSISGTDAIFGIEENAFLFNLIILKTYILIIWYN